MQIVSLHTDDEKALDTFDCDYNNLGTRFRTPVAHEIKIIRSHPQRHSHFDTRLQLAPKESIFRGHGSKWLIRFNGAKFYAFRDWQAFSGKDQHSIFADPKYVDAEHRDFRLQPDSANTGAGENGASIGAF